jgi:hypothetical protein
MNTNLRPLSALVVLSGVAFACHAAGPVVIGESLSSGDKVSGAIQIGKRTVGLPSGDWQLVVKTERNPSIDGSRQLPTILTLYFQEIKQGRLERLLEIAATEFTGRVNWLDEPCKTKGDSFYNEIRQNTTTNHFCYRIGFQSGVVDAVRDGPFLPWAQQIKNQAIRYSSEMPFVMAVRYSRHNYLRMRMAFNPVLANISSAAVTSRKASDWSGEDIETRPLNAAFYERLKTWAPRFSEAVYRAYEGDESLSEADFGSPNFDAVR